MARRGLVAKETLAAAEDHREEEDPELVDEVEFEEPGRRGRHCRRLRSPPGCSLSRRTSSSRAPRRTVVFSQSTRWSDFETTYFGSR